MLYSSILVGTDGSETATVAVSHAARLAAQTGAVLHIATAGSRYVTHAVDAAIMPAAVEIDPALIKEELEEVVAAASAEAESAGAKVQTHTIVGDPVDALCDLAKQLETDLLVVGNRGMKGIQRFFTGSVPNTISHRSPCSVLIVDTTLAG